MHVHLRPACRHQMKAQFHTLAGEGESTVQAVDIEDGAGGVVEAVISRLKAGWTVVLVVIVLAFAGSCIEEIAKRRYVGRRKGLREFRVGKMTTLC